MSFGVGAGDIAVVTTLAWQTYQSCKNSSEILKDLSSDVASLHVVWKHTLDFVQQGEVDEDRQEQLTTIERNSYDVLTDIESYSAKHESLASQSQPAWDHMEGGTEDVTSLKERVVCAAAQLTVFNTAVASSFKARIERKLEKLLADSRSSKRDRSILSIYTVESLSSEDPEAWRTLQKELEEIGVGEFVFLQHRGFIRAWLQNALASGAFEEDAASDKVEDTHNPEDAVPTYQENMDEVKPSELKMPLPLASKEFPRRLERVEQPLAQRRGMLRRALHGLNFRLAVSVKRGSGDESDILRKVAAPILLPLLASGTSNNTHTSPNPQQGAAYSGWGQTSPSMLPPQSPGGNQSVLYSPASIATGSTSSPWTPNSPKPLPTPPRSPLERVSSSDERPRYSLHRRKGSESNAKHTSSASINSINHRMSTFALQETYSMHEASLRHYQRTPAEEAKIDQARRSLRLRTRASRDRMSAPYCTDLASSGMEIPMPMGLPTSPRGMMTPQAMTESGSTSSRVSESPYVVPVI
ncbi:hypothetical protein MMC19_006571 [Ptychographa xylographoides]|nr:hypothetical protein [Ptychographa xylographoides]